MARCQEHEMNMQLRIQMKQPLTYGDFEPLEQAVRALEEFRAKYNYYN